MRIWMPTTPQAISTLVETGVIEASAAFAVTPEWASSMDEQDEEILEELRAHSLDAQIVVVAEVPAEVVDAESGQVQITSGISTRQISAFLAKSEQDDEDFSWFGPTEALNLLEFLG